jgi:hypothetical protein
MRALAGLTILVTLFAMAVAWQDRWTEGLARERDHIRTTSELAANPADGWSRLIVGRPSGAPIPVTPPTFLERDEDLGAEPPAPPPEDWDEPAFAPDTEHVVAPGEVLGTICQKHYGTARMELVNLVSKYNRLEDADDIDLGQTIRLPDVRRFPLSDL